LAGIFPKSPEFFQKIPAPTGPKNPRKCTDFPEFFRIFPNNFPSYLSSKNEAKNASKTPQKRLKNTSKTPRKSPRICTTWTTWSSINFGSFE